MGRLRICSIGNGLANQIFQYILSRYLEINTGDNVFFDDSLFFRRPVHNGYELEKVFPKIRKPKLLSDFFSKATWDEIIKQYDYQMLHEQLGNIGIEMSFVIEGHLQNYLTDGYFSGTNLDWVIRNYKGKYIPMPTYSPALSYINSNAYYYGFWVHEGYINEIKSQIATELEFAPLRDSKNIEYAEKISTSNSVALHIRRGDFVELGWEEDLNYYTRCIRAIESKVSIPFYFIFSDDIEWCESNKNELGLGDKNFIFIEGNTKEDAYKDLQLMSMCKAIIATPRSSFCRAASVLNKNNDVIVLR
jgi:hypothetical protein